MNGLIVISIFWFVLGGAGGVAIMAMLNVAVNSGRETCNCENCEGESDGCS